MSVRDGLVAEYLFRGNADDTSGNERHGVVHGARLTADRFGAPNSAFQFDGDDYIEVSPPPSITTGQLSVSAWARFGERALTGWSDCIVAQDDGKDDNQARRVFQLSVDVRHVVWHRMMGARDPMCKHRVRFGTWFHYVATFDGTTHRLYVDGVQHDAVVAPLWTHAEQPLHIGRKRTIEPHFFFRGAIDDVRIYDRALTTAEIGELYAESGFAKPTPPRHTKRDAISGRWGQNGATFLDLQYDGQRTLSGRVMNGKPGRYAPIGAGSFDSATGRLHLEGTAPHPKTGETLSYTIDGMLDDGEITVSAQFGGWSGNLTFTRNGARWPWRYALARWLTRTFTRAVHRLLGTAPTGRE